MPLLNSFTAVLDEQPFDLAKVALVIAQIEYPNLSIARFTDRLDRLGERAAIRIGGGSEELRERVDALNRLIYDEERFTGNRDLYDDVRNSCLNAVLERRLGIPITLALIYMEVARRAGLEVQGVGFPGHFLMRVPVASLRDSASGSASRRDVALALILDPFNGGAELDEPACRALLARHVSELNVDIPLDPGLLQPCTPRHMVARMLNNMKRTYVDLRQFPQARLVTDLLLAVDSTLLVELRDRGLLAYHLDNYTAALRDLEAYLRFTSSDSERSSDRKQVWEHVKALRRRVAGMN